METPTTPLYPLLSLYLLCLIVIIIIIIIYKKNVINTYIERARETSRSGQLVAVATRHIYEISHIYTCDLSTHAMKRILYFDFHLF